MIPIYKITNKLTGKSYIGQSTYCNTRLDKCYKNKSQFIDTMIEFDGVEQYTFEIIKETEEINLNYLEDYYIALYNTMYPNGYNTTWNFSKEFRSTMDVTPQSNQNYTAPAGDYHSIILTKPELKQLEWWQEFIWKYEHDKIKFYGPHESEKDIEAREKQLKRQGIELVSSDMENIIHYAPKTEDEYKKLKWEVEFKNNNLPHISYNLPLTGPQLSHQGGITPGKKQKYLNLKEDIEVINNKRIKYKINNYGRVYADNKLKVATIDYENKCLRIEMVSNRVPVTKNWSSMFEEGLLPKENVKIIDKNSEFVDFSQLKEKPSSIAAILFF